LLALKVKPQSRARSPQLQTDAAGQAVVMLAVSAVPERGKANEAVCQALAEALSVPPSSISVQRGHTNPHKTVLLCGDPVLLEEKLAAWIKGFSG